MTTSALTDRMIFVILRAFIKSILRLIKVNGRLFGGILLFVAISGISMVRVDAQIFNDTSAIRIVGKGIDYTYNFRFSEAHEAANEISRKFPDHPVNLLFKGIIIYWENFPLMPSSAEGNTFEETLRQCIDKCDGNKNSKIADEILLTNLSARGMLLLFYSDNNLSRKVIPLATGTYHYLRQSFSHTSFSPDFYFFTGLYNYYREAYPEFHPIYRPVVAFFPKGNKAQGISELEICAHKSVFLKADSYSFLHWIFEIYEKDIPRAIEYSRVLSELYPSNPHFSINYIRNLLMASRYDEGERLLKFYTGRLKNPFIEAQVYILNGYLQENKYKNIVNAKDEYNTGISKLKVFGANGYEFASIGYMGLSRISGSEGDQQAMRKYRRKADELNSN
jgi:tRNA threonylcarbamoyladenosine modification (KEOPS) complex  Pcc1 subunit